MGGLPENQLKNPALPVKARAIFADRENFVRFV
jgi:hypothetical protein